MSEKEYKAGMRLEINAHDLRVKTGANAFHSLIHAALRTADTNNFTVLARMFPKTHQELMLFRSSAAYADRDEEIMEVARLMARVRSLLGIGLIVHEIATEISNATGGEIDMINHMLSQNFNELVTAYEG